LRNLIGFASAKVNQNFDSANFFLKNLKKLRIYLLPCCDKNNRHRKEV